VRRISLAVMMALFWVSGARAKRHRAQRTGQDRVGREPAVGAGCFSRSGFRRKLFEQQSRSCNRDADPPRGARLPADREDCASGRQRGAALPHRQRRNDGSSPLHLRAAVAEALVDGCRTAMAVSPDIARRGACGSGYDGHRGLHAGRPKRAERWGGDAEAGRFIESRPSGIGGRTEGGA
jgi:hypothetical protein